MQQQQESGGEESWLEEQCHREINGRHDEYERELADWARSKKRMIRCDDLLAYLAGKQQQQATHPYANRRSPKPEHHRHHNGTGDASSGSGLGNSLNFPTSGNGLSGLNDGTGEPLMHLLTGGGQLGTGGVGTGGIGSGCGESLSGDDLHTFKEALVLRPRRPELFVVNEIARQCKRPDCPIDDKMDICHYSSKRQRFM